MKLKTKIIIGILFYFAAAFIFTGVSIIGKDLGFSLVYLAIGLAIGFYAFKYMRRKKEEAEELELNQEKLAQSPVSNPSGPRPYASLVAYDEEWEKDDEEWEKDDEREFSIKGINYANLDDSYLGDHDGYIKAISDHPKDPYAIAVYVGRKRVGWLPGGNSKLHEKLLSIGGKAKADIFISKGNDDYDGHSFYYGKATIQG